MTILHPILGVAFAAFCVWLTIRIVNRRERWAKRMLAVLIVTPTLYILSFGPACWISSWSAMGESLLPIAFAPIVGCLAINDATAVDAVIGEYAGAGAAPGWGWVVTAEKRDDDTVDVYWTWQRWRQ